MCAQAFGLPTNSAEEAGISIVALQKEVARVSVFGKQSSQSHSNRNPQSDDVIEAESTLLIAGHPRDITKFAKEFGGS